MIFTNESEEPIIQESDAVVPDQTDIVPDTAPQPEEEPVS